MSRNAWIGVMIALGLGLALRLVDPYEVRDLRPRADALEYDLSSVALADGEGFVLPLEERAYPPRYTIGYPLLTALARGISDEHHSPALGVLVTMILGLVIVLLGARIGHELGGDRAAVAAAMLLALSPLQIHHSRQVMSDAAALAFLFAAIAMGLSWARSPQHRPRTAALLGVLAGFGICIRLTNVLLVPFLAILVLTRPYTESGRRWAAMGALLLGVCVGVLPQAWVNAQQHDSLFRTGYSFWIPKVYGGDSGGEGAFAWSGNGPQNFGPYARQLSGWEALQQDLRGLGWKTDPAAPRSLGWRGDSPSGDPYVMTDRTTEPGVLYPIPIVLLALLGLGMRGRGWNVARSRRAIRLLVPTAAALFLFYSFYSFRELRFLLPVQACVLLLAARVFSTHRPRLKVACWGLAGISLLSALPDIAAASRAPQGSLPYGRYDEETRCLEWLAQELPRDAMVAVRTHGALFEYHVLKSSDRDWVPIGRDEHRIRIEEQGLEAKASERDFLWSSRRERLSQYRQADLQIDLDDTVIDLMRFTKEVLVGARSLRSEDNRKRAVELLDHLPQNIPEAPAKQHFRGVLADFGRSESDLGLALFELTNQAVAHSFAEDLGKLGRWAQEHPGKEVFLCDLYLFEYGALEPLLRGLIERGETPSRNADGTSASLSIAADWKGVEEVSRFQRPGFPERSESQTTEFRLYRVLR